MTSLLLDTASLYFRAFYGVPDTITAPDGTPVNAVRGFLDMLARLVTDRKPDRLVACLDEDWRPAFRVDALPSYKAHRLADGSTVEEAVPDLLTPQVPVLFEVLDALGVTRVGAAGFEADDVIATLAYASTEPVEVVTGDRDLFQVVRNEPPVTVLYTARGIGNLEAYGEAEVARRYGIPGHRYADLALLRGDPSDGLPGVPGIGEKTAATLIQEYEDVDALLAAAEVAAASVAPKRGGLAPRVVKSLLASRDYLAAAPLVVNVRRDVPLPAKLDTRRPSAPTDPAALAALTERWGLDSSVERASTALYG